MHSALRQRCLPEAWGHVEREHYRTRRARPQPEEHRFRDSAQPADGGDGGLGIGQVVARLRHHLRRRPAALCRVAVGLRAAIPGAHRKAGRRCHRRHRSGGRHPAEEHDSQSALDRGHGHRDLRLPAPALRARRPHLLPELRPGGEERHGRRSRGPDSRARRRHARAGVLPAAIAAASPHRRRR